MRELAGYLDSAGVIGTQDGVVVLRKMASALAHRGPDDAGAWSEGPVALGHRRLAILDLSSAGHQPMHSADRRYVLVFNGEIYNHLDLRIQLGKAGAAPAWRGYSIRKRCWPSSVPVESKMHCADSSAVRFRAVGSLR